MDDENIVIERGYIPVRTRTGKPVLSDKLASLEPGDSMWVACERGKKWVHVQVTRYVAANGDNLRCRMEEREGRWGVRVMNVPDDEG